MTESESAPVKRFTRRRILVGLTLPTSGMKSNWFPDAVAEDMEAFGVAMACQMHGVPLEVVRGISNEVGDRDHSQWQIDKALRAAAELVIRLFDSR